MMNSHEHLTGCIVNVLHSLYLLIRFCVDLGGRAAAGSDEGLIDGGVVVDRRDVHEEQ